jgi:hypothetical protein
MEAGVVGNDQVNARRGLSRLSLPRRQGACAGARGVESRGRLRATSRWRLSAFCGLPRSAGSWGVGRALGTGPPIASASKTTRDRPARGPHRACPARRCEAPWERPLCERPCRRLGCFRVKLRLPPSAPECSATAEMTCFAGKPYKDPFCAAATSLRTGGTIISRSSARGLAARSSMVSCSFTQDSGAGFPVSR